MIAQIETIAMPALRAVVASEEYFQEAQISLLNENFRRLFLGMNIPEVSAAEILAHPLEREEPSGKALAGMTEPSLSQYCHFLMLKRGSEERFVTRLRGRDGRHYTLSAIWGSDMTGDPFWEVVCPPLMSPERLHAGTMIVSLK